MPVENDWNPNPEIISKLKELAHKMPESAVVGVGPRVITWDELAKEVEEGTPFGRKCYWNYVRILRDDD